MQPDQMIPRSLNARRLRDYPRLILIAFLVAIIFILTTRNGWQDAQGNILGYDFIMMYSGGLVYAEQPASLYDFDTYARVQPPLIAPTTVVGALPFVYPPYMAAAMKYLTSLPLAWALIFWTGLTILLTALGAAWAIQALAPQWLREAGLTRMQMAILIFSFFPFMEGLKMGQNHGVTFFLYTGLLAAMLSGRSWLAGGLAALTAYKPQYAFSFLLVWVIWRDYKALLGYGVVAGLWGGLTIWQSGWGVFQTYINFLPTMLKLPYLENYGTYLMMTPYGFALSVLPQTAWQSVLTFSNILTVVCSIGLGLYAFTLRNEPPEGRVPVLALAVLYPMLATPQVLLHDTLILALFFLLWARTERSPRLLYAAIGVYLGSLVLTPVAYFLKIALLVLVPMILAVLYVQHLMQNRERLFNTA